MTDALLFIVVWGVVSIAAILLVRDSSRLRWQRSPVTYALRLPHKIGAPDVAAFLTACTGLRARRWQRPFVVRAIVLELVATSDGIMHYVSVPAMFAEVVLGALRAAVPG